MVSVVGAANATDSAGRVMEKKIERTQRLEEMKMAREEAKEQRVEAKVRFEGIKDERKLKILERIETNLQHINEVATDHFMNVLTRLSLILEKISARAEKASQTLPEIATAQTAIDTASAAAVAQSAKIYDLPEGDEATISGQVRISMQQLKSDLAAVRQQVSAAREAVHAALQALKGNVSDSAPTGIAPTGTVTVAATPETTPVPTTTAPTVTIEPTAIPL